MKIAEWIKSIRRLLIPQSLVLMYHRVAEPEIDPWQLAVSSSNFEQQLQVLKKTGLVVPVSILVEQLYSGEKLRPSIAITFDDGYADNYLNAKPLLEKYNLPATFFICTDQIGKSKEFWWDELAKVVLLSQELPPAISLYINESTFSFDLQDEQKLSEVRLQQNKLWNGYIAPSNRRCQLYMLLWQQLSPLTYQEQQRLLGEIKQWAGLVKAPCEEDYAMTKHQLLSLASGRLFSLGAHTVSHPLLSLQSKEVQSEEITNSKRFLKKLTGKEIDLFTYPSGNFNDATIEVLREQSFKMAFTTKPNSVKLREDFFRVGRFQVNNWSGSEFKQLMSNWS